MSDGCTGALDLYWRACCDEHDTDYQTGRLPRKEADRKFLRCMRRDAKTIFGRYVLSFIYFGAVRLLGGNFYMKKR